MDIAVWRFGADADERRYLGNVNRNTFRRLWWRAEILGPDIDLARLGEDELVNIMERPTVSADRRLARAVAAEFLRRVDDDGVPERMQLMREAMKRLLRLTPLVAFTALDDSEIKNVVRGDVRRSRCWSGGTELAHSPVTLERGSRALGRGGEGRQVADNCVRRRRTERRLARGS